MSEIDPENAATYAANATATRNTLSALDAQIAESLTGLADRRYILPHDGYQYFEVRYELQASAAIAGIDARNPGPAQISALRDRMAEEEIVCVFSDVEIGDRWARLVTEGTTARTTMLDAVGAELTPGPALYEDMMIRLANAFVSCIGGDT